MVLRYSPPIGYQAYTSYSIAADGTGSLSSTVSGVTTHTLDDATDYKISAPSTISKAIVLKGGRNVVWIGGHVQIDNQGSFPSGDMRRGLLIQDGVAPVDGRVVHLEGILIDGDDLADAIDLDCPATVVQIQMYRAGDGVKGCHFRSSDDRDSTNGYAGKGTHPDVIQPWGGCKELRVDYLSGLSAYQGLFLNSLVLSDAPAATYISHMNWRAYGHTSSEEGPYLSSGYTPSTTHATFDATTESWSNGNSGTTLTQGTTSPQAGAGYLNGNRPFSNSFDQVWVRSPTGVAVTSNVIGAWVRIPSGAAGTWNVKVGFNLSAGAGSTLFTSASQSATADGAWHFFSVDITSLGRVPADVDRLVIQVTRGSGAGIATYDIGVDTVTSGAITTGFAGPSETYYGMRAISLGDNWGHVYTDTSAEAGIYIQHSVNSGWTTPGNTGPSRKGTSGFFNTRFYDNTHALADANGYVLDPPPGTAQFNNAVFPTPTATASDPYVDWTGDARLHNFDGTGNARIYNGPPPGGDFVTAASVGTGYVGPGYRSAIVGTGRDATGTAIGPILNPSTTGTVLVPAGATASDVQALVTANATNTVFSFAANTTYTFTTVVTPKAGQQFIGLPGTVISGGGVALSIFRASVGTGITGVVVKNLTLVDTTGPVVKCAENWIVSDNDISNGKTYGIQLASGASALRNFIHHNHQYGIDGAVMTNVVISNNEIAYNNWLREMDPNFDAGGFKILRTTGVAMDRNYVHDNYGPGMWCDTDNFNCTYTNNRVDDNAGIGIFHEISHGTTLISGNLVQRNGLSVVKGHSIFYGADIYVSSSDGVEVANNTVVSFTNGIGGNHNPARGTSTATGLTYGVTNMNVHDNNITISGPAVQAAGLVGGNWTGAGNSFTHNTYHVPNTTGAWWAWNNANRTQALWQGTDGQDATGTFLSP